MDAMKIVKQDGPLTIVELENATGIARLTNWQIYPGIILSYIKADIEGFSCYAPLRPDVFAINHCEKGRIECKFKNGEYLYMGEGDMSVGRRSSDEYCHTAYFPSSHYHGLSILVDTNKGQNVVDSLLDEESFSLDSLCKHFCGDSEFGVIMQEDDAMKHLFYEFYHVPEHIRHRYFRIKVLETLLFLSAYNGKLRSVHPVLNYRQVQVVKEIHAVLAQNVGGHRFTITDLSKKYGISATVLKHCFKEVYGMTMYQYQKEVCLKKAKQLLAGSEKTIMDISHSIGYENSSKFSASFKRATGMLPKEYRKLTQEASKTEKTVISL